MALWKKVVKLKRKLLRDYKERKTPEAQYRAMEALNSGKWIAFTGLRKDLEDR